MILYFKTNAPYRLRASIIELVESEELRTWEIFVNDGKKYLAHTGQWGEKGAIYITRETGQLKVEVLSFDETEDPVEDFEGYYLGRFCELMFNHFKESYTIIDKEL